MEEQISTEELKAVLKKLYGEDFKIQVRSLCSFTQTTKENVD